MQVVGLQLVVAIGETTFHLQINTTTQQQLGRLACYFSNALFFPL
jgi:hypothetical protein